MQSSFRELAGRDRSRYVARTKVLIGVRALSGRVRDRESLSFRPKISVFGRISRNRESKFGKKYGVALLLLVHAHNYFADAILISLELCESAINLIERTRVGDDRSEPPGISSQNFTRQHALVVRSAYLK
jgi:hypothetical protein